MIYALREYTIGRARAPAALVAPMLVVPLLVVVGCSVAPAQPSPSPVTTPPPTSSLAAPTSTPSSGDPVLDRLRAALLVPSDAGPTYRQGPEPSTSGEATAPCGGAGVGARFPDARRAGTSFQDPDLRATVQQTLAEHPDAATARAAFDATAAGLDCPSGRLAGIDAQISPPRDLLADVGGDRATGWQLGGSGVEVLVVAVQAGPAVLTFRYLAPTGADLGQRPDALSLTRTGVQRFLAR